MTSSWMPFAAPEGGAGGAYGMQPRYRTLRVPRTPAHISPPKTPPPDPYNDVERTFVLIAPAPSAMAWNGHPAWPKAVPRGRNVRFSNVVISIAIARTTSYTKATSHTKMGEVKLSTRTNPRLPSFV